MVAIRIFRDDSAQWVREAYLSWGSAVRDQKPKTDWYAQDISELAQSFARAVSASIRKYARISGELPEKMPESFMAASALLSIGRTMTLESKASDLWAWNRDAKQRRGVADAGPALPPARYLAEFNKRRVDAVVFTDNPLPKNQQDFIALVEFKKYYVSDRDIDRLKQLLRFIDTCRFGFAVGFIDVTKGDWMKDRWAKFERNGVQRVLGDPLRIRDWQYLPYVAIVPRAG